MKSFTDRVTAREAKVRAKNVRLLRSLPAGWIEKAGLKMVIPAFKRALKTPGYRKILERANVDPGKIKTPADFTARLPVLTKDLVFPDTDLRDLCVNGDFYRMKSVMTSSGYSGSFSFGFSTADNIEKAPLSIDTTLEYAYSINSRSTLFINCLPMGVKVNTRLPIAETSVREDMVFSILRKVSPKYEQTLILGDPHFLKKIVEEAPDNGVDLKRLNASPILGEDWFSESFRAYLAHLLDWDYDKPGGRFIGSTMGVAELDVGLFHESPMTVLIRRKARLDHNFRKILFGKELNYTPVIFHYYPHRTFLETVRKNPDENAELLISMLGSDLLAPLMRYNTRDSAWLYSYDGLSALLENNGLVDLIPDIHLPVLCVGGRNDKYLEFPGGKITPEEIKEGLYEDFGVASQTTGYVRLSVKNGSPVVEIQLKEGIQPDQSIQSRFEAAALKYTNGDFPVKIYAYRDFPYGMVLDYERKFKSI